MKNQERIEKLLQYFDEIRPVLKTLKIKPVLWGSTAYVLHTKDFETEVNDIDFLISIEHYKDFLKELSKNNIKYEYVEGWDCIQLKKDDLMIEFDPLERYEIAKIEKIRFKEYDLNVVSKQDLKNRYRLASESQRVESYSTQKTRDYRKKYEKLLSYK